jgi:hypothetical protein
MSFIMGKVAAEFGELAAVFGEVAYWRHGCEGLRAGRRSRIPEIKKAALTVPEHFQELLASARTRFSAAAAEALNGLIQTAKRKSRGFCRPRPFRAIIFLLGENLPFNLPDPFPPPPLNPP